MIEYIRLVTDLNKGLPDDRVH